ncbi:protein plastid transcriptionally active 16, chloroplastic-like [Durio zibethinus]|uniref:Protein plastid transcriptionally active 16, chloroplastic-like n=1 Tax=Durio zibethinus TaxID=66656 RepID=A0A6P5ZMG7_DURZI|nr:protein plastid transcriptionally active 16, chloroplastic-like [Durio zibethinus]
MVLCAVKLLGLRERWEEDQPENQVDPNSHLVVGFIQGLQWMSGSSSFFCSQEPDIISCCPSVYVDHAYPTRGSSLFDSLPSRFLIWKKHSSVAIATGIENYDLDNSNIQRIVLEFNHIHGSNSHLKQHALVKAIPHEPKIHSVAKSSGPFQLGKAKGNPEEGQTVDSGNSSPFRFNFGKVPDMKTLVPVVIKPSTGLLFGNPRRKDPSTAFVAGATGQAGIRNAQTLLRQGFTVRAGVPELAAARELALLAAKYKIISNEESKRLNAVESTFQDAESIAKAIGNASKVVVTIGPGESGPSSAVSTSDDLQVIQAAQLAGIGHVAIVYDGNAAGASTYNVLDGITSFFGNLLSQSQPLSLPEFLQKIIQTDVSYTFLKTTLIEDYSAESSFNIIVSAKGSIVANDYKVM